MCSVKINEPVNYVIDPPKQKYKIEIADREGTVNRKETGRRKKKNNRTGNKENEGRPGFRGLEIADLNYDENID